MKLLTSLLLLSNYLLISQTYDDKNLISTKTGMKLKSRPTGINDILIGSVIKNEFLFIYLWFEYHIERGFKNFLVIDNNSDDGTWRSLNFIKSYYKINLKIIKYTMKHQQVLLYKFMHHYSIKEKYKWILFLDSDEFIHVRLNKLSEMINDDDSCAYCLPWCYENKDMYDFETNIDIDECSAPAHRSEEFGRCLVRSVKSISVDIHGVKCDGKVKYTDRQEFRGYHIRYDKTNDSYILHRQIGSSGRYHKKTIKGDVKVIENENVRNGEYLKERLNRYKINLTTLII